MSFEDIDASAPLYGWFASRSKASAINYFDALMVAGQYRRSRASLVPGSRSGRGRVGTSASGFKKAIA